MIKYDGENKTAKQAAQELIADRIFLALDYWYENESINCEEKSYSDEKPMTKKEYEEVRKQMHIIAKRALKPCGYTLND